LTPAIDAFDVAAIHSLVQQQNLSVTAAGNFLENYNSGFVRFFNSSPFICIRFDH
jgi:hypothetical protein